MHLRSTPKVAINIKQYMEKKQFTFKIKKLNAFKVLIRSLKTKTKHFKQH